MEASATWEYSTNGGTNWTTGTGTFFTLAEGTYAAGSVQVRQTDVAGNISTEASNANAITVDTTAPSAPGLTLNADTGSSSSDGITSNGQMDVSGLEAGATWEYSTNGGTDWTTGTGTSFTLAEATYAMGDVQVRQTDAAGNVSTVGSSASAITVDTTAPSALSLALNADTGPDSSDGITSNGQVDISGVEAGATWEYSIDGGTSWTTGTGTFFTLAEGTHAAGDVQVRQTDVAGNVSNIGANAITVDTTVPSTPSLALNADTGSSSSDGITNNGQVDVSGLEAGAIWEYSTNGGTNWTTGTGTFFTLAEGTYAVGDIQARQTDAAGNVSTAGSNASAITVDTTAPSAPMVAVTSPGNDTTPDVTITLPGDAAAGDVVTVTSNAGTTDTYTLLAADITAGTATVTLSDQGADGDKSISATLTDPAGNVSSASTAATYALDTAAPSAPTVAVTSPGNDATPDVTITLPGDAVAGDVVTVTSNAGTTDTYTLLAADITAGTATVTLSDQGADGGKSITATLTDTAGNASSASAAVTYTLDTALTANVSSIDSISNDTGSNTSDFRTEDPLLSVNITLSAVLAADEVLEVSLNGGTDFVTVDSANLSNTGTAYTIALTSPLPNGTTAFQVRVADEAGNTQTPALTQDIYVDTSGLTITSASLSFSSAALELSAIPDSDGSEAMPMAATNAPESLDADLDMTVGLETMISSETSLYDVLL